MVKREKKNQETQIVEEITDKLFSLILVKTTVEISEDKENDAFVVDIQSTDESGLLIGARGKTLLSLQTVLGLIYRQRTGEWKRIIVNVADWREKEEDRLRGLAEKTAERAVATGEPQFLYNLNPSQRRIVHMVLSENEEVDTESQGEGNDRYLVVSPKK